MAKSRTEKIATNITFHIAMELIKLICGLVLPRLILSNYGSAYNGIVQSVSQFISVIAIMKMGIAGATRVALFKPLANKDYDEISEVLASTEMFMRKIALIFLVFVFVFACIYPIWISTEFDWLFSFSLVLIISISTFAEYYFGFTYEALLNADQRDYIYNILSIVTIILNTIVSVVLINANCSIHVVKLGSAFANVVTPIGLYIYCHKHYQIKKIKHPKMSKIPDRWQAFAHEIASFVNDNTDIMILTVFTNLLEVSVYTVYHYVTSNLKKIITSFTSSFGAAFGDMYAKGEMDLMNTNLRIYELIVYSFVSVIYSTTMVMIIPFVLVYTKGVNDVSYYRLGFAIVATLAGAFDCFRYPYKQIITNTGFFRQTKPFAIAEACMNLIISILTVRKFGLIGVSVGTLITMMFGAIAYSTYVCLKIVKRNPVHTYIHIGITLLTVFVVYRISLLYMGNISNYIEWLIYAVITGIISLIITVIVDFVLYREDFMKTLDKIFKVLLKKKGKKANA